MLCRSENDKSNISTFRVCPTRGSSQNTRVPGLQDNIFFFCLHYFYYNLLMKNITISLVICCFQMRACVYVGGGSDCSGTFE